MGCAARYVWSTSRCSKGRAWVSWWDRCDGGYIRRCSRRSHGAPHRAACRRALTARAAAPIDQPAPPCAGACRHAFCISCLSIHLGHSISDRQLPLRCPQPTCGAVVSCRGARLLLDAAATDQLDEVGHPERGGGEVQRGRAKAVADARSWAGWQLRACRCSAPACAWRVRPRCPSTRCRGRGDGPLLITPSRYVGCAAGTFFTAGANTC